MADNVGYTPGTGANIAADDIGGVLYQPLPHRFVNRLKHTIQQQRGLNQKLLETLSS